MTNKQASYRQSICGTKQAYRTPAAAYKGLRVNQRRGWPALGVYRCPHCHQWHIGQNQRRSDRRADWRAGSEEAG